jgi:hypothetical protein
LTDPSPLLRVLVRRALAGDDLANMVIHFEAVVLDRYRGAAGYSLIRTNTVGRVRREGGWSLDVGIPEDPALVHVFAGDLLRLPAEEREHWSQHAVALPLSATYIQMRMAPGSCHDDGEVRAWQ